MLGSAEHSTLRAPQSRQACVCKNLLLEPPFSWFLTTEKESGPSPFADPLFGILILRKAKTENLCCLPSRPKLVQKILLQNNCFGTINFVKITKQSLCKANSFACSLANRDKPVAATLRRKCSGGIIFVITIKIITKVIVPRNYFVIISARMVFGSGRGFLPRWVASSFDSASCEEQQ